MDLIRVQCLEGLTSVSPRIIGNCVISNGVDVIKDIEVHEKVARIGTRCAILGNGISVRWNDLNAKSSNREFPVVLVQLRESGCLV